ncbi:MAG TPA: hypothetical protein VK576_09545, partial [Thermoleophilia bacterium]|nr:hypothetical protein [Thermoleophilia bacterium]
MADIDGVVQLTGPRVPVTTRVGHRIRGVDPVAAACVIFIAAITIVAVFAPWIAPYSPNQVDILDRFASPSAQHILGTDALGRDLFSRLVYGA